MFGLTRREQRWKAEYEAAALLANLTEAIVLARERTRLAEAEAEILRLRLALGERDHQPRAVR